MVRILVVDDEPDVESLVTQKFRRRIRSGELDFLFAHDGRDALDVLEKESDVDVVLSDINMPRMDGLTLLERLNERSEDLKTVMVSAYGDLKNIRAAMNLGAFDFVTKPIEFEDLETTLEKTLKHLQMLRELKEQKQYMERANATLSRYFSPAVADSLSADPDCLSLRGEWRTATFLFTDLANFTPLVESSKPEVIVSLLNEYMEQVTDIVFAHGGTVTKFVGDAVHAVFGAPTDDPAHARHAVECALAVDAFALDFSQSKNAEGIPLGVTRVGINSGPAIIGNFGGENFFDYTAHGDAVNVASRLEQANKTVGTRICVGESVVEEIDDFHGRPIGKLLLKGKTKSLKCFEALPRNQGKGTPVEDYRKAFAMLEAGDAQARQAFAALVGAYDEDPLTMFHLGRLLAGQNTIEIELSGS